MDKRPLPPVPQPPASQGETPLTGSYLPEHPPATGDPWQYPAAQVPTTLGQVPDAPSKHPLENLLLNIGLYLGSFLIISAAALLVNSVATAPVQILLLCALTLAVYGAGLATYRWVPRLRLASYSFTATGLALIPLCGVAIYNLAWGFSGALLWLLVSLVGTLAVFIALALMPARVMAYIALAFLVSDVLAVSKTVQVGLLWYFVGLLLLATALALVQRFSRDRIPTQLALGITDSSRIFVPATMAAVLVMGLRLQLWEAGLIFTLGAVYSAVFMLLGRWLPLYIQARLYSLAATLYFTLWVSEALGSYTYLALPAAALLLLSALLLSLIPIPKLPWRQSTDALVTWVLAQLFIFISFFSISIGTNTVLLPAEEPVPLSLTDLWLSVLSALNVAVLAVLARRGRLRAYLPALAFILGSLLAFLLPAVPLAVTLLTLAASCLLLIFPSDRWFAALLTGGLLLPALLVLTLEALRLSIYFYWAPTLLGVGAIACYLYRELTKPLDAGSFSASHRFAFFMLLVAGVAHTSSVLLPLYFLPQFWQAGWGLQLSWLAAGFACFFLLLAGSALLTLDRIYRLAPALPSYPVQDGAPPTTYGRSGEAHPTGYVFSLYTGFILILLLATFWFGGDNQYLIYAALLLGILLVLLRAGAETRAHIGVLARIYLLWSAYRLIVSGGLSFNQALLALLLISAVLSAVSWFLHRAPSAARSAFEGTVGRIFGWVTAFFGLLLVRDTWSLYPLLAVLVLLLLAVLWQFSTRRVSTSILQVVLGSVALLALFLPSAVETLGLPYTTAALPLGILMYSGAKIWAVATAPLPATVTGAADYLGSWGYRHNAAIAVTGLVCSNLAFLVAFASPHLALSLLAVLGATVTWWLQSSPGARHYALIIGLNILLLRLVLAGQMQGAVLYFFQSLVLSLSLLTVFDYLKHRRLDKRWVFWLAFGLQVFVSLLLPLPFWASSLTERLVIVLVTLVLLGASVPLSQKIPVVLVAGMLSYQVLYILGGLNAFTLFFLGFVLIGLVIWRLLARSETGAPPATAVPPAPAPGTLAPEPWAPPVDLKRQDSAPAAPVIPYGIPPAPPAAPADQKQPAPPPATPWGKGHKGQ